MEGDDRRETKMINNVRTENNDDRQMMIKIRRAEVKKANKINK